MPLCLSTVWVQQALRSKGLTGPWWCRCEAQPSPRQLCMLGAPGWRQQDKDKAKGQRAVSSERAPLPVPCPSGRGSGRRRLPLATFSSSSPAQATPPGLSNSTGAINRAGGRGRPGPPHLRPLYPPPSKRSWAGPTSVKGIDPSHPCTWRGGWFPHPCKGGWPSPHPRRWGNWIDSPQTRLQWGIGYLWDHQRTAH